MKIILLCASQSNQKALAHKIHNNFKIDQIIVKVSKKVVFKNINFRKLVYKLKNDNNAVMIITHYQRLLDHIVPDFVHVLFDGKIVKSGTKDLAHELEKKGYDWIKEEVNK